MKKLLVVLFVFSIVGGYVFGATVAELTINGTVADILRVELDQTTASVNLTENDELISGDIDLGRTLTAFANVGHDIVASYDVLTAGSETIPYTLKYGASGSTSEFATVTGSATTSAGETYPLWIKLDDTTVLPTAATYSDEVTFTISATN